MILRLLGYSFAIVPLVGRLFVRRCERRTRLKDARHSATASRKSDNKSTMGLQDEVGKDKALREKKNQSCKVCFMDRIMKKA